MNKLSKLFSKLNFNKNILCKYLKSMPYVI